MKIGVLLTLVSSGAAMIGHAPVNPLTSSLSYRLDIASEEASAIYYCPSPRQKSYHQDFDHQFGERIRKLISLQDTRFKPNPPPIHTLTCVGLSGSDAEQDARHQQAMKAFARKLDVFERESGRP